MFFDFCVIHTRDSPQIDLLTSRAFERVARLWARSAIVRARSASERARSASERKLPHQTRKPSERLWESLALRFFACWGIHCTLWLLAWLSNTLNTLNTYSRLMSHINTLQSSPPAVKTYFPSYEHTKLDTYEKERKNSNKTQSSYCSHIPQISLVCELLPQSTFKWQACSHSDILVSRSY